MVEILVVNVDSLGVVIDGVIKLLENIFDFHGHLLSSLGLHEFLVERKEDGHGNRRCFQAT
jgi:hypothetical protein